MATYRFRASGTDGKQTEGVLEADSPQEALKMVKEQGLFPLAIEPISVACHAPLPVSLPGQAVNEVVKLSAFGWRIRLRKSLVFHLPVCFGAGIGFYLFFQGKPTWLAVIITVGCLIAFGIAGVLVEQKVLGAFVCPRCQAPIDDWDIDAKRRIFYDCPQCRIRWDIGYKLRPGRRTGI